MIQQGSPVSWFHWSCWSIMKIELPAARRHWWAQHVSDVHIPVRYLSSQIWAFVIFLPFPSFLPETSLSEVSSIIQGKHSSKHQQASWPRPYQSCRPQQAARTLVHTCQTKDISDITGPLASPMNMELAFTESKLHLYYSACNLGKPLIFVSKGQWGYKHKCIFWKSDLVICSKSLKHINSLHLKNSPLKVHLKEIRIRRPFTDKMSSSIYFITNPKCLTIRE